MKKRSDRHFRYSLAVILIAATACCGDVLVGAAIAAETSEVALAEGKLTLQAPQAWARKQPSVRIIEAEFAAPAVGDDPADGRITVMGAGGSVKANIDRWIAQFAQTERNKSEKKEIAGQEVHLVDLVGTYNDKRGPFAPAVVRKDYRMLGAIIVTEKLGQYFVKFYGPVATVNANEKAFYEMIESVKLK